ncbi:hypothetical protein FF38_02994, partial [Lucilia cuprina]
MLFLPMWFHFLDGDVGIVFDVDKQTLLNIYIIVSGKQVNFLWT